jgi:hypothetical protein
MVAKLLQPHLTARYPVGVEEKKSLLHADNANRRAGTSNSCENAASGRRMTRDPSEGRSSLRSDNVVAAKGTGAALAGQHLRPAASLLADAERISPSLRSARMVISSA